MNKILCAVAFAIGLIVVCWVGIGYVGVSPLALTVTALIGVVYLAGAAELFRFHAATAALVRALSAIPQGLAHPGEWLARLPAGLQNPVRLRIEGERAGLPGPALTPYLVGLLVLLGMLGTFLGMVVTLQGAVVALESTTDLHTIRSALAAPVKGLGVAFGTSIAGVAASAMLGLISALCRRARMQAGQALDTKIATELRGFSLAHQRQETFAALQMQARALPELVDRLQAMMVQMERHSSQANERLLAEQADFYRNAREAYTELASAVDASLKQSLSESARLAGETIRPAVEATMSAVARESTALHERVAGTVETQLEGLSARFDRSVSTVADTWTAALAEHRHTSEALGTRLQAALTAHADTFAQRSASLLASVDEAHAGLRTDLAATTAAIAQESGAVHARLASTVESRFDGLADRLDTAVAAAAQTWSAALARQERSAEHLSAELHSALVGFADTFAERSTVLLAAVGEMQSALHADLAARDQARLDTMSQALEAMAVSLHGEWRQSGARSLAQQEQICATLGQTARDISAEARAQASATIAEVAGLMQRAAEAPQAAAEVIGELRQALSASMARDNAMLDERSRIMETLATLFDAINHAAAEQRAAIDALVASSATALERAGSGFSARIESESEKMAEIAGQISGGAVEVASLSEAFGHAVQLFGESSDRLMTALQRIEGALGKSMARSDEQLAYYVAQAREIIDLSIMSQQQIVGDLQQLSGRQAALAGEG